MGVIYAGEHMQTGQVAAVKTVAQQQASKLGQIRREIHALARLEHPGIVKVLDFGVADGQPWYAMERLEGSTLRDLIQTRWGEHFRRSQQRRRYLSDFDDPESTVDMSLDSLLDDDSVDDAPTFGLPAVGTQAAAGQLIESLSLVQRVCEILAFVHGEGIVHRDLKPDNIFIRNDGLPVLVDFGLVADARGTIGREVITLSQRIAGSPAYMPPEQIRGNVLDARCDLYAIGCVLYNLVTGQPPFTGTEKQVTKGHLKRQPVPPAQVIADVPTGLNGLIMDLLAKDPDDRIGYAENVVLALEDVGTNPPPWSVPLPKVRAYLYRSAFVGRKEVMADIQEKLALPEAGRGHCIMVAGESGAGKTRLALETAALAIRRNLEVISGECLPTRGDAGDDQQLHSAPLYALRSLMEAVADYCVEQGRAEQDVLLGEQAAVLAAYFPSIFELPGIADLPPPPPLPGDAARNRIFRSVSDTLAAYAKRRPLLLVLDDLQWADDLTLDFLQFLLDGLLDDMPVLLMGTFRSEERTKKLDALSRTPSASQLELSCLNADEVQQMTCGMLALRTPPEAFVRFLATRSNGNPFFIAEYLRCAVAEQVLVRDRFGRWSCADSSSLNDAVYEQLPLPQSLRQLIELRLGKLSHETRQILDTAALIGRSFDMGLLQQIEFVAEEDLIEMVDELVRRQIIEPEESDRYRFIHDKIREIAESYLTAEAKAALHGRIAVALETFQDSGQQVDHARLGHHWALANNPLKAAPRLAEAARHAREIHAVSDAIQLARAALREIRSIRDAGLDSTNRWRVIALDLYELLGDMYALQGAHGKARTVYAAAVKEAGEKTVVKARLFRKSGKAWEKEHKHEQALEAYSQAEFVLDDDMREESLDWRHEWIQIKLDRIWVFYWMAQVREIDLYLSEVQPYVETVGLPKHRYHYFMSLVNRNHRQHRYRVQPETLDYAKKMLDAAVESNGPVEMAFAHFVLGFALLFADQLAAAEAELYEARQGCQRIGDVSGDTRAAAYLTILYRRQGRIEDTRKAAKELLKIAQKQQMHDYIGVACASLGWVAWKEGDGAGITQNNRLAWDAWERLSFPHPFQWTAGFTELRLLLGWAPAKKLAELARLLHDAPQMRLPDPIHEKLAAGINAFEADDQAAVKARLDEALQAAEELGYL